MATSMTRWLNRRFASRGDPRLEQESGLSRYILRRLWGGAAWEVEQLVALLSTGDCELLIRHAGSRERWRVDIAGDGELVVELLPRDAVAPVEPSRRADDPSLERIDALLTLARAGARPSVLREALATFELSRRDVARHPAVQGAELMELVRAGAFADVGPATSMGETNA